MNGHSGQLRRSHLVIREGGGRGDYKGPESIADISALEFGVSKTPSMDA